MEKLNRFILKMLRLEVEWFNKLDGMGVEVRIKILGYTIASNTVVLKECVTGRRFVWGK